MNQNQNRNQEEIFNELLGSIITCSPLVLLLIGPPCSGKGTNAWKLKHALDAVGRNETLIIETGKELRKFASRNTTIIEKNVASVLDKGEIVDIMTKISLIGPQIMNFLSKNPKGNIIFDGSPRDIGETRAILDFFSTNKNLGHKITAVDFSEGINSCLTSEEAIKNLSKVEEEIFKRNHHRRHQENRNDDLSKEIVRERIRLHFKMTSEILAYIKSFKIPVRDLSFVGKDENEVFMCFLKQVYKGLKSFEYQGNMDEYKIMMENSPLT